MPGARFFLGASVSVSGSVSVLASGSASAFLRGARFFLGASVSVSASASAFLRGARFFLGASVSVSGSVSTAFLGAAFTPMALTRSFCSASLVRRPASVSSDFSTFLTFLSAIFCSSSAILVSVVLTALIARASAGDALRFSSITNASAYAASNS